MTGLEDFELSRVNAFFRKITSRYEIPEPVSALVITHLLAERPAFLRAVGRLAEVAAVLPKPKSIDARALEEVTASLPVDALERAAFADPARALEYPESRAAGRRVVLLDVGGYFAPGLEHMCAGFSGQIIGVVEDTENGHQRYEALGKLPCPVFSVARSPLKDPEDYLVGQSVTFSAEALIRARVTSCKAALRRSSGTAGWAGRWRRCCTPSTSASLSTTQIPSGGHKRSPRGFAQPRPWLRRFQEPD